MKTYKATNLIAEELNEIELVGNIFENPELL